MKHFSLTHPCNTDNPEPMVLESLVAKKCKVFYNISDNTEELACISFEGLTAIRHRSIQDNKSDFIRYGLIRDALYEREGIFILLFRNECFEITASSFTESLVLKSEFGSPLL